MIVGTGDIVKKPLLIYFVKNFATNLKIFTVHGKSSGTERELNTTLKINRTYLSWTRDQCKDRDVGHELITNRLSIIILNPKC